MLQRSSTVGQRVITTLKLLLLPVGSHVSNTCMCQHHSCSLSCCFICCALLLLLQVFHPTGRWAAEIIRMLGGAVIHDVETEDCRPVTFVSFNNDTPDHAPVEEVDKDVWQVTVDFVGSPGHELGWTPDGKKCECPVLLAMVLNCDTQQLGNISKGPPNEVQQSRLH